MYNDIVYAVETNIVENEIGIQNSNISADFILKQGPHYSDIVIGSRW